MSAQPRLFYLVKQVESAGRARLARTVAEFGLTVAQYTVMSRLAGNDGLSSARLARFHSVSPQTMNEQIATLMGRGLIARDVDPDNRRILLIKLTAEGERLLAQCDREVDRVEKAFFNCLDNAALADLRSALSAVIAHAPAGDDPAIGVPVAADGS